MVSGHGVCSMIIACTDQQHSVHRRINQLGDIALTFFDYPVCSRAGLAIEVPSLLLLLLAWDNLRDWFRLNGRRYANPISWTSCSAAFSQDRPRYTQFYFNPPIIFASVTRPENQTNCQGTIDIFPAILSSAEGKFTRFLCIVWMGINFTRSLKGEPGRWRFVVSWCGSAAYLSAKWLG